MPRIFRCCGLRSDPLKTGYKIFDSLQGAWEALRDRSRLPVRHANQLPHDVADIRTGRLRVARTVQVVQTMRAGRAIFAARKIQKRKRSPTVGSILLRWRKPKANPLFTCENMSPK